MNRIIWNIMVLSAAGLWAGCQTSDPSVERGPGGTMAYYVKIESSVPGVTIETNKVFAGKTPLVLKVFGDVSGGFHNFGSPEFVLSALPPSTNEFSQIKIFRTGKNSAPGDRIPGFMFFNMSQRTGGLMIDSIPDK